MKTRSAGVTLALFSNALLLMISRLLACWLVVLVLSPFTAPFARDLGRPIRGTGRGWPPGPELIVATGDTSQALVLSPVATGRQKLVSSAGRFERVAPAPPIGLSLTNTIPLIQQHDALRTVLRL